MAEIATIARPYADALFKACTAGAGVDLGSATAWVEELAVIAADPQLRQLSDNPKVSPDQLFDLIAGLTRYALPDMGRNFLRTMIENGRLDALPDLDIPGQVEHVGWISATSSDGIVTYDVQVVVNTDDAQVRIGMTGEVTIETGSTNS